MKAIILAGGKGTRLAPYTTILPKPLVPVGEMPILEIVVRQLIAAGFDEIVITLGHLGELIRAFFSSRPNLCTNAKISFITEEKPTGTAGSLKLVPDLNGTFLAMNGDILTTLNYRLLVDAHRANGAALTIAGYWKQIGIDLGVLELDQSETIVTGYREKPTLSYPVSMGIYVYEPRVLDLIPDNQYFDFPSLVLRLLERGERVSCFRSNDRWLDIGRPADHVEAQNIFEMYRDEFGVNG